MHRSAGITSRTTCTRSSGGAARGNQGLIGLRSVGTEVAALAHEAEPRCSAFQGGARERGATVRRPGPTSREAATGCSPMREHGVPSGAPVLPAAKRRQDGVFALGYAPLAERSRHELMRRSLDAVRSRAEPGNKGRLSGAPVLPAAKRRQQGVFALGYAPLARRSRHEFMRRSLDAVRSRAEPGNEGTGCDFRSPMPACMGRR